jgi:CRISPR-associated exonuclease Cas4
MTPLEGILVTPTELRQHHYCPRILFFERCTPVRRRETRRMEYGRENHDRETKLERERSLQRYGLLEGERRFSVQLHAPKIGLTGEADLIVISGSMVYPVEFKDSTRAPDLGHKL